MTSLGSRLLEIREAAKKTQRDLSREIGLGQAMVSLIEQGKRVTTTDTIEKWAAACGARLVIQREGDELAGLPEAGLVLAWRDLKPGDQATLKEVLALLPSLNNADRRTLVGLLEIWRGVYLSPSDQAGSCDGAITDRDRAFTNEKAG